MNKEIKKAIEGILDNTDYLRGVDIDGDTPEEVIEYIEDRIREEEVIYYSKAIKFLSDEDASLIDSIDLAIDMGYELKNINSELLATILIQDRMNTELYEIKDDIENAFEV